MKKQRILASLTAAALAAASLPAVAASSVEYNTLDGICAAECGRGLSQRSRRLRG